MKQKVLFLLSLFFVLTALAPPAFSASQSARYWPVGLSLLDFVDLDAVGKPTCSKRKSNITSSNFSCTALTTNDGTLLFHGDPYALFYRSEETPIFSGALTDDDHPEKSTSYEPYAALRTCQALLTLPAPGEPGSYYLVFVNTGGTLSYAKDTLYYVKLTPDTTPRHGEVIPISEASPSKGLTVAETAAGDGYWVISCLSDTDGKPFELYKLTKETFQKITTAAFPDHTDLALGAFSNIKLSPDGTFIAYGGKDSNNHPNIALFPFDSATGAIGDSQIITINDIESSSWMGGCEFSPNGRYLYAGVGAKNNVENEGSGFYQIDLTVPANSPKKIAPIGPMVGALQLAPDGNIYAMIACPRSLFRIQKPNKPVDGSTNGCSGETVGGLFEGPLRPGLPVFIQTDLYNNGATADLSLSISSDRSSYTPESEITLTLTVTNEGPDTASRNTVTCLLPEPFTLISDDGDGAYCPSTGSWSIPSIPPDSTATISLTCKVDQIGSFPIASAITNSGASDPDTSNNTSSLNIDIKADMGTPPEIWQPM